MSILPQITDSIKLFADTPIPDVINSIILPNCVCYDFIFVAVLLISTLITIAGSWVPSLTLRAGAGIMWIVCLVFALFSYLPVLLISILSLACIFMSIMGWVQLVVSIQGLKRNKEMTESDSSEPSTSVESQLLRQNNLLLKIMTKGKKED